MSSLHQIEGSAAGGRGWATQRAAWVVRGPVGREFVAAVFRRFPAAPLPAAAYAVAQLGQAFVQPVTQNPGRLLRRLLRQLGDILGILHRDLERLLGVFALLGDYFLGISRRLEIADHRRGFAERRLDDLALLFGKRLCALARDLRRAAERIEILQVH